MDIEITQLLPADQPRWADLWGAYLAFYETVLPPEQYQDTWARLMRNAPLHGLAARHDGAIVGITHFLFHASAWTTVPVCYLQDLFVDPVVRRGGVGRKLIEAVAERAQVQASTRLYWMTQADNAVARGLYDKIAKETGFVRYSYALG